MNNLNNAIQDLLPEARELLCDLIKVPSLPGQEMDAFEILESKFHNLSVITKRIPLSDDLKDDPEYSSPIPDIGYNGRHNLHCRVGSPDGNSRLIVNAHLDVVPASQGMPEAFHPKVEENLVFGRGACDDKGPAVSVWLACAALHKLGKTPAWPVSLHFVCEEENGGNGTLAMVRNKEQAEACIVMEPTSLHPITSIRGAVWFKIRFFGTAGHSGSPGVTHSSLTLARRAMDAIESYHQKLLGESRGYPLFDRFENPMPLTYGKLEAGNWPAAAPSEATLEGVIGFLPNRTASRICEEIRAALIKDAGLDEHEFELDTTYRHDCSVADEKHWVSEGIIREGKSRERSLEARAFPASCDAVFYSKELGIPTVVFGPGDLRHAHSKAEQIDLQELADAAAILAGLMLNS